MSEVETKTITFTREELMNTENGLLPPKVTLLLKKGAPLKQFSGEIEDGWYMALNEVDIWQGEKFIFKKKYIRD